MGPEQKIKVEEALRAYTLDAAYASFEESIRDLWKRKLADLVMIDQDLTRIARKPYATRVFSYGCRGRIVFEGK
jgi:predicted amidohydrolase YtcJ